MSRCQLNMITGSLEMCGPLEVAVTPTRQGGWTPLQVHDTTLLYFRATTTRAGSILNFCPYCGTKLVEVVGA